MSKIAPSFTVGLFYSRRLSLWVWEIEDEEGVGFDAGYAEVQAPSLAGDAVAKEALRVGEAFCSANPKKYAHVKNDNCRVEPVSSRKFKFKFTFHAR